MDNNIIENNKEKEDNKEENNKEEDNNVIVEIKNVIEENKEGTSVCLEEKNVKGLDKIYRNTGSSITENSSIIHKESLEEYSIKENVKNINSSMESLGSLEGCETGEDFEKDILKELNIEKEEKKKLDVEEKTEQMKKKIPISYLTNYNLLIKDLSKEKIKIYNK